MAYSGDCSQMEDIPYRIVPGDSPLHRESVFLERAIAGERVRLAMGLSLQPVQTRTLLTEGMDHAAIAEQYYEPPLVNIIPYACHACPAKRYSVTNIMCGIVIMCMLARHLNILVLGETEAKAVGMPVTAFRMGLLFVAAMTTATSVCVSGNIGFVGLVIPHMMRMLIGPDHRVLLPASALGGAAFLVFCDSLGRIIMPPAEVRVGIMTAFLGTPYFLYLLRRMQKQFF